MNLMSGITLAQQKRLAPLEVGQRNDLIGGEPMAIAQHDQKDVHSKATSTRQRSSTSCGRDFCFARPEVAACAGDNYLGPPCVKAAGDRTAGGHLASFGSPLWWTRSIVEIVAGQVAVPAATGRGLHAARPHPKYPLVQVFLECARQLWENRARKIRCKRPLLTQSGR
jgi:hypothetical protein